jgi:hypothetical protein
MKKGNFCSFLYFILLVVGFLPCSLFKRQYIQAKCKNWPATSCSHALILKESIRAGLERGLSASEVLNPYQATEDNLFYGYP